MSDKTKFHRMTKPIKFRKVRLVLQTIVLWLSAQRERIIYLFNYLLYKLNILQRYSYRDNVEKVYPLPNPEITTVETRYFKGDVIMNATKVTSIDRDYFYRVKKDGSKKTTLTLKDEEKTQVFLDSHLENICIMIAGKWYQANHMPTIKAVNSILSDDPFDYEVEFKTVEYDLTPLRSLRMRDMIDVVRVEHMSGAIFYYHYEKACCQFKYSLDRMDLSDLNQREIYGKKEVVDKF